MRVVTLALIRDDISAATVATIVAGLCTQLYAVYYLTRATLRGVVSLRPQMAANAALALGYFAATLWLLFSTYDQATWNTVMIGVSLVVWVVTWAGPAKWSIDQQASWEARQAEDKR